ncbi:EAL domain-containing protein [Sphingomonas yabuuchiae]|nr:EAL domain-containing protein [Sphingomonas yabuuchiae]
MAATWPLLLAGGDGRLIPSPGVKIGFLAEPIVDLRSPHASPLYSECLARAVTRDGALLTGGDIVPELEATDDIHLLDMAVLEMVLGVLSEAPALRLGCNLSPNTLAHPVAWRALLDRIERDAILADRLTLEVTENFALDDIPGAAESLRQVQQIGCRIAVDDFGAGYAVSAHLGGVDVDWDIVKIDRVCFQDISKTDAGADNLSSLIRLAHIFAPAVIIEGIETREHLAIAREAGASFGQGWLFEDGKFQFWRDES